MIFLADGAERREEVLQEGAATHTHSSLLGLQQLPYMDIWSEKIRYVEKF